MSVNDVNSPVSLLDVNRGNREIRDEVLAAIASVYDSGRFLHGPQVRELEAEIARHCHVSQAVGCGSGSDALLLALMAYDIGPGDEVIVPSFTFFATASCVSRLGATIVFADIDPLTFNIDPDDFESKITSHTRAVIPVHLFGQSAAMDRICSIASRHDIPVIEDAAQAIGAAYHGRPVCSWGELGCISFYPTKNLGGFGDGGMVTSQSESLADRIRLLSAHGMRPRYHHSEVGINSRLDTFQAAALMVKIRRLDDYTRMRRENAERYADLFVDAGLASCDGDGLIQLPYSDPAAYHVWNQFGIRVPSEDRDALRSFLQEREIGSEIYYPIPLHLQACFRDSGYKQGSLPETELAAREILHLPIYPEITPQEQETVVAAIGSYYKQASSRKAA